MNAGPTTPAADPPVTAGRRRILARTRLDFWLDALLLVAYTLAYSLGFTGIATHEWLGIGLGVVLLVHLTLHWDWVIHHQETVQRRRPRAVRLAGQPAAATVHDAVHRVRHPDIRGGVAETG